MKSKSPAFQFYPQDFLVGSAMLSAEETGAYIRLLCTLIPEGLSWNREEALESLVEILKKINKL
jgi:hypothetical protein